MASHRVVKWINIGIAILIIVALGVAYWYLYRPLPQTSGTVRAPVGARATIVRDAIGVPHITAASIEDALFLQGYVLAQDRLWQLDILRRLPAGELSEVLGRATIESDQEVRRLRLRRVAEERVQQLKPQERAYWAAYARGVNYFLETNANRLPVEFSALRYAPRPWRIADTMLIGMEMYRTLTNSWQDETRKMGLLRAGDREKVEYLYPTRTGAEVQPGSNAWALAGPRTASGKPILANDPHLSFSLPATWYLVHLQAPGLNVIGAALPGVPGVILGHNDRIAWGVTNLHFDVQDLYREKLDAASGRYAFRGQVEQAQAEREIIAIRGADPVDTTKWVTRHGPVVVTENHELYALRWAAHAGSFRFPFIDINRAQNWQEFRTALADYPGPAQNFVYADVDGNIGYQATGPLPIRRNHDGDEPVDGASGAFEWEGWIPFAELPSVYNPQAGLIVTANQNPFPAGYPYRVNGSFAPRDRAHQIRSLLTKRQGWQARDMLAVQKDVYSPFSHFLAQQVVQAYQRRGAKNPNLNEAVDVLRTWNGQMEKDLAAPLIATLLYQHLRRTLADRAAPGKGLAYEYSLAPAVIEKLLRERPAGWFPDIDKMLLDAFADAVEEGQRMQSRDVRRWQYGVYNEVSIRHPVLHGVQWIGPRFSVGPVPMSGSGTTPKQTSRRLGPSMRMVVDLADWDRSLQNITLGQSGQPLSSHYRDQWPAYYVGDSFPMQFRKIDGKETLTVEPLR